MQDETIGVRLKRLRLERGLSQRELAAPGVSYAYISRIEAGARQPSVKALRRARGEARRLRRVPRDRLAPRARRRARADADRPRARRPARRDPRTRASRSRRVLAEALAAGDGRRGARAGSRSRSLARDAATSTPHGRAARGGDRGRARSRRSSAPISTRSSAAPTPPGEAGPRGRRSSSAASPRCASRAATPSLETRYATLLSYALSDAGDLARAEEVVRRRSPATASIERPLHAGPALLVARPARARGGPAGVALANARRAIALLETTEDTINLARAHLLAASIMITRGEPDAAARHLDDAERLLGAASSARATPLLLRVKRAQVAALRGDGAATVALAREALAAIGDKLPPGAGIRLLRARRRARAPGRVRGGRRGVRRRRSSCSSSSTTGARRRRRCRAWARMLRAAGQREAGARRARPRRRAGPASGSARRSTLASVPVEIAVRPRGPYSLALSARLGRRRDAALPRRRRRRALLAVDGRRELAHAWQSPDGDGRDPRRARRGRRAAALGARARRRPLGVPAPRSRRPAARAARRARSAGCGRSGRRRSRRRSCARSAGS